MISRALRFTWYAVLFAVAFICVRGVLDGLLGGMQNALKGTLGVK